MDEVVGAIFLRASTLWQTLKVLATRGTMRRGRVTYAFGCARVCGYICI